MTPASVPSSEILYELFSMGLRFHSGSHGLNGQPWWRHWDWRIEILLPILIFAAVYIRGWIRLRRGGHHELASLRRLVFYVLGSGALVVALLSAVDLLGEYLFLMHMVQHLLLTMIAAPLIWLAAPFPIGLWGLPKKLRISLGGHLKRGAWARRILSDVLSPSLVWIAFVGSFWIWHLPEMYELALIDPLMHDLEHMSFFGGAMLFWWRVIAAGPSIRHPPLTVRIIMILSAFIQNEILAVAISFADKPLYTFYEVQPRIWDLSVMQDQAWGGAIMWIPGGMMFGLAAILLLAVAVGKEEDQIRLKRGP